MKKAGGHIASLDGIRGIAILLVVLFHAGLGNYGWIGVQLFFVLSGFLITGILWKERDQATSMGYKFRKFWTRRALRIFPLYFGYLLALGGVYLFFHFPPYYVKFIPYLLTYTFNYTRLLPIWQDNPLFTHMWSLCVEEQFYIFFPLVVFLCPRRFTKGLMVSLVFLAPLIRYGLGQLYMHQGFTGNDVGDATYRNTLSHLDAFFMGGLIPLLNLEKRVRHPWRWWTGAAALMLGAGAWNYLHSPRVFSYVFELGYPQYSVRNDLHVWGYTLIDFFFACSVLVVVRAPRSRFLEMRWLVRIGQVSYGMYMFNLAVWMYFFQHLAERWGAITVFVPYVLVVWGLSEVSYRFYEMPFMRLKDKFFPGGGAAEIRETVEAGRPGGDAPAFSLKSSDA